MGDFTSLNQRIDPRFLGGEAGDRATLVQFSSAFCAPCRATRIVLDTVADVVPGVSSVDLVAESHLELVRELGIESTPTVFIVDPAGRVLSRAEGVPTRGQVLAALAKHVSR